MGGYISRKGRYAYEPHLYVTSVRPDGRKSLIDNDIHYRSSEPSFTDEENTIIEKAKEDGTYLKAPNGKDTKSTPKQWAQVRTKAFKEKHKAEGSVLQ